VRRAFLTLAALGFLLTAGCCTADQRAVSEIRATNEIVLPQYQAYVDADPALQPAQKDDRKKLIESLKRLVDSLIKK
jgi:hypothetical protein